MFIINFLLGFQSLKVLKVASIILTIISFFTFIFMPTNLESIFVLLMFTIFALIGKLVMRVDAIKERFEFADVIIDHKGVRNSTKFVVLYDKENEGEPTLLTKDQLNKQTEIMLKSQRKTTNFEMVLTKDEFDKFISEEGF